MINIELASDTELHLIGSVEHDEAVKCKQIFSQGLSKVVGDKIQIDLSGLSSVSSITLAFLLFGLREAKQLSKDLTYTNMPPSLFNMARVSGIETILTNH